LRRVKLKDIADKVDYGLTEKAKDEKVGPKFLRITDIQNGAVNWDTVPHCKCTDKDFEKNKLESGDIVFARTGATTGKSFLINEVNEPTVFASYLIRLRLNSEKVLPEFVAYFFKSDLYWRQIYADSDGATLPSFNATKLKKLQLPLPTLSEQKAIVAKLDRAQRLIDIDRQMLAKYDELIQSVFLEMFGDPVRNEKGWERKPMNEIGELKSGGTPSRKNKKFFTGEIDWYTTGELESMYLGEAEEK
jgi:type I restriction enzyme, S subunit